MFVVVKVNQIDTFEMEISLYPYDSFLDCMDFIRDDWENEYNSLLFEKIVDEDLTYYEESYARITLNDGQAMQWKVGEL